METFADQAVIAIENTRLLNELRESLQQQTATADVLKVISRSTFDLQAVLDTLVESAARLCEANKGVIFLRDGDVFRLRTNYGFSREAEQYALENPMRIERGSLTGRVVLDGKPVHIPDALADPEYKAISYQKAFGYRSMLGVPLLREGVAIGIFALTRDEVSPFSDKQIELVTTFADQAVIAIENARLLNELRQRTDDLTEALEQQTATSEVLKIVANSSGELQQVFDTMLANATRLCGASYGAMWLRDGDGFRNTALHGALPPEYVVQISGILVRPGPDGALTRIVQTRKPVHVPDLRESRAYLDRDVLPVAAVELAGVRTIVSVPMFKADEVIGAITIYRKEIRPFADKQIELVQNFAAQAVIAIENTRLLNELRESLQQQTATSEVLKVISSSPGELEPVFSAMLENATRICEAKFGNLFLYEGGVFRTAALYGAPPAWAEARRRVMVARDLHPDTPLARVTRTKKIAHIADAKTTQGYIERDPNFASMVEIAGARTILSVPMLKEDELIGVITIYRQEVKSFTDKQITLMTNFAAQAVIAIENARLLNELRQRTTDLSKSLDDLRTTQDRLVQTEKLASLGQLTAGIAHEMKNPLNFVNNFSAVSSELIDELQDTLKGIPFDDKARAEVNELTDTLRGNLDKVVQHGKRADAIVKNMLQHSREGSGEHRPVDINALVEESLNLAWHGARAEKQGFEITLKQSFDPSAGEVDVFPQDITRALLNLISNGFYAATKRGEATNGGDYEPTLAASTKNLGDRVEIKIRDNGTGIPLDVKEKMFNPFFTTKPSGEGTGLGLSISHDIIVKQHAGSIEVDTQPGEFTEIRVILPRVAVSLTGGRA